MAICEPMPVACRAGKKRSTRKSRGLCCSDERYPSGVRICAARFCHPQGNASGRKRAWRDCPACWFRDVGWVGMHSALGQPEKKDIMLSFNQSPYRTAYSLSHNADQNSFILNAWGKICSSIPGIANTTARRITKGSHSRPFRKTQSSSTARARKPPGEERAGKILGMETGDRIVWTAGAMRPTPATRCGRNRSSRKPGAMC